LTIAIEEIADAEPIPIDPEVVDLGIKYAPTRVDELAIGADDRHRLQMAIRGSQHIALLGAPGTGKSAMARMIAKELKREVRVVDGTQPNRDKLLDDAVFATNNSTMWKEPMVVVIEEADTFTKKKLMSLRHNTMEDAPFILVMNDRNALHEAVLSRCEVFDFNPKDKAAATTIAAAQVERALVIAKAEGSSISEAQISALFAEYGIDFRKKLRALSRAMEDLREGRDLGLPSPPPVAEAVTITPAQVAEMTRELVKELSEVLSRHLHLPKGADLVIALYILHAYSYRSADWSPILAILAPQMNCGKSQVLNMLQLLIERAKKTFDATGPAAFAQASEGSILLFDEADRYLNEGSQLVTIFNAGVERDAALVHRFNKEYNVYGPKVVARIGAMVPATTESRCISVRLGRAAPNSDLIPVYTLRRDDCKGVRSRCQTWTKAAAASLEKAQPVLPKGFYGRTADKWRALFAIADLAGAATGQAARQAAKKMEGMRIEEPDYGALLVEDIQKVLETHSKEVITSTDLVGALTDMKDRPWQKWRNPFLELPKQLGTYGLKPKNVRSGGNQAKGYHVKDLQAAFEEYPAKAF
jgi:putative DNA primase/helicase